MTLPTSRLFVPNINFRETGLGLTTNAFVFFGGIRPTVGAPRANHGYQLQGTEKKSFFKAAFSGGGVATKASASLVYVGSTFNQYTQNVVILPMMVNSKPDWIWVVAITPASANVGAVVAKVKEILTDALAGDMPLAADGFVFSKNNASRAQISAALQLFFGNDEDVAFDEQDTNVTGDTLVFTALDNGAAGNYQSIISAILPGASNLDISIGDQGEPIINGVVGDSLGGVDEVNDNATPTIVDVPYSNTQFDFGSGIVGLKGQGTLIVRQIRNPILQAILTGSNLAIGPSFTQVMGGGNTEGERHGLVLTHPSVNNDQIDIDVIYEAQFTGGRVQNFGKGQVPGLPVSYSALATQSADPIGTSYLFRQFA